MKLFGWSGKVLTLSSRWNGPNEFRRYVFGTWCLTTKWFTLAWQLRRWL